MSFEFVGELADPMACNCSMCGRAGTLLVFVPVTKFRLLSGEETLRDYQFGKRHVHHRFCGVCGIKPFGDGPDPAGATVMAINLRCVEGVDLRTIEAQWYDGAAL